ncbi:MAG: IPT/TIG domain-containing protein, partial [Solirubrobacteraceae bacterium]
MGYIQTVNTTTNASSTINCTACDESYGIAITPNGQYAYVANQYSINAIPSVTPVDLATGQSDTPITDADTPLSIAITPDGQTAVVGNQDGTVTEIDLVNNTVEATLPQDFSGTPSGGSVQEIAIAPDGRYAYALTGDGVTPIDLSGFTALSTMQTANAARGFAIAPGGSTAYVTEVGQVQSLDIAINPISNEPTGTVGAPIMISSGDGVPTGSIAVTPDGSIAYVVTLTNSGYADLVPIDLSNDQVEPPISTGETPSPDPEPAELAIGQTSTNTVTAYLTTLSGLQEINVTSTPATLGTLIRNANPSPPSPAAAYADEAVALGPSSGLVYVTADGKAPSPYAAPYIGGSVTSATGAVSEGDARVQACPTNGGSCTVLYTYDGTSNQPCCAYYGFYAIYGIPAGSYTLTAFPPAGDSVDGPTPAVIVTVPSTGTVTEDLSLSAPPVFTAARPPLTIAAGSAYDYTFAARPTSTFSLAAGAPSWLSIDPSTGELTGTVPSGTTSFSYAVTATNPAGSVTAGPFFVSAIGPVTVTGTVIDSFGSDVSGAVVDACLGSGGLCFTATTTSSGAFTVDALPGTSMVFTVYPPAPLASSATDPIFIPATGLTGESLGVPVPADIQNLGLTVELRVGATPVLNTFELTPVSGVTGCANGLATVTTVGRNLNWDFTDNVELLPQTSPGTYAGDVPPEYPIHGPVEMTSAVDCPPPTSALAPSVGPASGGTTVTLTGSGFTGTTEVDFGSTPASSFTVLSDDAIQALAPAGTGTVPVTVFGGSAPSGGTVVDQYTYQAVDSVSPASGPSAGNTWVIIDGTGLSSATEVLFGQAAASFYVISDSELEALSPPGTGTQDITVQTLFGGTTPTSTADQFTYSSSDNTQVAGRNAAAGPSATGTAVTDMPVTPATERRLTAVIDQRSLSLPLEFRLSAPAARQAPAAAPQAAALLPQAIPPGTSLASVALSFVYTYAPQIYSQFTMFQHLAAEVATEDNPTCQSSHEALAGLIGVTLTKPVEALIEELLPKIEAAEVAAGWESGPGLLAMMAATPLALHVVVEQIVDRIIEAAIDVAFGDCPKPPPPPTPPVPPPPCPSGSDCGGGGTGGGGTGGGGGGFSPNAYIDPGGNVLDTNGNPISGATVTILRSDVWAGPFAALDPSKPGILPAVNPETTAPDGSFDWDVYSGYYEIQASASGCTAADGTNKPDATIGPYPVPPPQLGLTVTMACANEAPAPQPVVNSISATGGPAAGGTPVTILGTGFTPASTASFGGVPASDVTYLSPQMLTAVSPAGSGMTDVVVTSAGGSSATSAADEFYYGSPPTVTGLSVTQGPGGGGTVVTVDGTGLTDATVVGFGGTPGSSLDVESDTELQVTTPAEQPGSVDVVVDTPAGGSTVSSADQFTFLPAPPVCAPVSVTATAGTATPLELSCTGAGVVYDQPSAPAHGTLTSVDAATGAVTYTPADAYSGSDSFTYTAHNAGGTSSPATVTATVVPSTTLSSSLSGGGQSGSTVSVPAGTAVSDTATLTGANALTATGTVSYNVYSDPACMTLVTSAGGGSVTGGVLPGSSAETFSTPGSYYWQASYSGDSANGASSSTCGSEIETVTAPACAAAPTITTNPSNETVTAPAGASFTAAAMNTDPDCTTLTVQWQVSSDGGLTWAPDTTDGGSTTGTLTVSPTSLSQSGHEYEATFTNAFGSTTTAAATLAVNPPPCATVPTLTGNPSNVTVTTPAGASFTAAAMNTDPDCTTLTVQWPVSSDGGLTWAPDTTDGGSTTGTLTVSPTSLSQSGTEYEATFTNAFGSTTTAAATLTVNPPACAAAPSITTNPSNQTVTAPATATFTAAASTPANCAAPTVQWSSQAPGATSFTKITGATSTSYTTPTTTTVQNGTQYDATFTNAFGSTTTNAVTLTVTADPTSTSSTPSSSSLSLGASLS